MLPVAREATYARALQLLLTYLRAGTLYHAGKRGGLRHGHEYKGAGDLRDGALCSRRLRIDQGGAVEGGRAAGANTALWLLSRGAWLSSHYSHPSRPPLSDSQAECRNIEDKNQILLELEEGVGSVECNSLVIGLMRKALVAQTAAYQARQRESLDRLFDDR